MKKRAMKRLNDGLNKNSLIRQIKNYQNPAQGLIIA